MWGGEEGCADGGGEGAFEGVAEVGGVGDGGEGGDGGGVGGHGGEFGISRVVGRIATSQARVGRGVGGRSRWCSRCCLGKCRRSCWWL